MPLTTFMNRNSSLSPKEATVLYSIWKTNNSDSQLEVPPDTDSLVVASLITKGFLKPIYSKLGLNSKQIVSVTGFGKEVIKKIVLSEKSIFEKKSSSTLLKIASKQTKSNNWLNRWK